MGMITTIAAFDELRRGIERDLGLSVGLPVADVALETPIPWPHKLLALPNNYRAHTVEMGNNSIDAGNAGFFMKSNASLSGPLDAIVLPERRIAIFTTSANWRSSSAEPAARSRSKMRSTTFSATRA